MSGETQPRRRKDKRKKKGRAEVQDTEQWQDDQLDAQDDNQFYVEPDSVSDDGTGDEEMKGHSAESGGSSCVTVLVFMVLLAAVGVLLGLIYVQSQGIAHVETPAQPVAQPRVETIVETITEGGEASPPADDQGEGAPADQQEVNSVPSAPVPDPAPAAGDHTVTVTVDQHEVHQPTVEVQVLEEVQPVVVHQPTVEVMEQLETVVQVVEQPVVTTREVVHTSEHVVPVQQTVVEVVAVAEDGSEQVVSSEVRGETDEGRDGDSAGQRQQQQQEQEEVVSDEPAGRGEDQDQEQDQTHGAAHPADSGPPDQGGGQQAEVVEQVIEEHIVYVDAPPDQQQGEQVVYVESPPVADGIQLEGSEPQLEEQYGAQPAAPPPVPRQMAGGQEVVQEERLVRMRQVVRQVTDADGNVQEEVISEEEVPEVISRRGCHHRQAHARGRTDGAAVAAVSRSPLSLAPAPLTAGCCLGGGRGLALPLPALSLCQLHRRWRALPLIRHAAGAAHPVLTTPGDGFSDVCITVTNSSHRW